MAQRKEQSAIDTVFDTMYANVLDAKILKHEGERRIQRTIERLDSSKRPSLEDEKNYRLERFDRFAAEPEHMRSKIFALAQKEGITLEEAYARIRHEDVHEPRRAA